MLAQKVNTVPADSFGPGAVYPSATGGSIAVGDFDGDGRADLAIASSSPDTVSIRLGNGDGTFQAPVDYPTGGSAGIVIGDFNGDGKADLAVAEIEPYGGGPSVGGAIRIFLGNGDGTFQPGVDYAAGMFTVSVAIGDFNGDGIADLAAVNRNDDTVSILLGNGDGTFQQRINYPTGESPYSIVVGDFNNDGKPDLAVQNLVCSLNVFLSNGDGSFQPKISYPICGASVITADFDGDGNTDLAISNSGVTVYLGNGKGGFQSVWSYDTEDYQPLSVEVCDCNDDGKLDLAFATSSGGGTLLPGNGDGTFQPPKNVTKGDNSTVAIGDFNGDGQADLVLAGHSGMSIYLGRIGRASSTILSSSPNPSVYTSSVLLTARVSPATTAGTVTFYDGATSLGTSSLTDDQAVLTTKQLKPGLHTLTAVYSGDAVYFSSTSPAIMQTVSPAPSTIILSSSTNPAYSGGSVILIASVAPAEATGTVEFREGPLSLGIRTISGETASLATSAFAVGSHLLTATYNGDANYQASVSKTLAQVVTTGAATTTALASSAARLILGQNATFTATVSPALSGSITFYDGVNLLGTGTVAGGQASLTTSLLSAGVHSIRAHYGGNTAYAPSTSSVVTITVRTHPVNRFPAPTMIPSSAGLGVNDSVVMGDFNGDGMADLAAVTSNGVAVTLGNGDGTFQTAANYATDAKPGYVAAGDFNGDGKADLAVTTSSGTVSVLLGNGDGTFQKSVSYAGGPKPGPLVVGDVNGDGYADVALNTGYVLLGKGDGTFQNPVQWLNGGFVAVGDFNGDGKIDFVDSSGVVQLGHGDGTFDARAKLNVAAAPFIQIFATIGDFDADGNQDVAVMIHAASPGGHGVPSNYRDTLTVYPGQGDGTFRPAITVAAGASGQFPGVIAVGDFNGDGNMDVALVNQGTVNVFPGNGDGSFGALFPYSVNATQSTAYTTNILLGDFNGDGRTDIAFAASGLLVQPGQLLPASTMRLDSSPNPSMYGQGVILTATVEPSTATGTVTFYDAALSTPLGAKTLQNGQASIIPNLLKPGTHSFKALYGGDTNFPPTLQPWSRMSSLRHRR